MNFKSELSEIHTICGSRSGIPSLLIDRFVTPNPGAPESEPKRIFWHESGDRRGFLQYGEEKFSFSVVRGARQGPGVLTVEAVEACRSIRFRKNAHGGLTLFVPPDLPATRVTALSLALQRQLLLARGVVVPEAEDPLDQHLW